ncbi:hypothetical protein [uncultured Microbacterium sp.]|uniref:TrbL/VirB6 plasmid conjugal transfer protein n=1 Tax=uncultured Microbacterium sp. TaxID=191216 RepID=A0A1Y5P2R3_9MICO|nr:hypothetical protein [uncultured Microbacterium sp.]SBS71820.1 membrane hypothetical protein [uncultured Microbacterium sp.]
MNIPRALLIGATLGFAAALGTMAPATALTLTTTSALTAVSVTGETWSAPSFPVTCRQSSNQITCTPNVASEVEAQECFLGVAIDGARATVCTTYDGHKSELQAAGGKLTLVAYGCSLGDAVCVTFENAGRGMALGTTAMMFAVSDAMRFDTSTTLWDAAAGEWSFWNWAVLIVVFAAMVWAIAAAAVSGDRGELVGAIVRSFIAIPAVPLTLWLTGHLLNAVDDLTWYVMGREGPIELFATLQRVMWAGGSANYFFAFLIHGLLLISMLLLMLVFAFRNIVLAALIMVGPIAWMVFPIRGIGPQWVVRYASAVVVLLLTGPLTIGFVTLIVNGLAGVSTIWDPQSWPLLVGLVLVAFAPFAIFGLFSFVGAVAADGVGSGAASHAGRMASHAARSAIAIPTRLGATPAGIPTRGGSSRPGAASAAGAASPVRGATSPAGSPQTASPTTSRAPSTTLTAPAPPAGPTEGRSNS